MKKLISVIPITILILMLLSNQNVYAAGNGKLIYFEYNSSNNLWYAYPCTFNSPYTYDNLGYIQCLTHGYWQTGETISEAYNICISRDSWDRFGPETPSINTYMVVVSGVITNLPQSSKVFDSVQELEDYINPPPTPTPTPTPTPIPAWYQGMWDTLADELGQPEFWFGEWFIDIIDSVFNNEEDEPSQGPSGLSHSTHIKQVTPAPTPTPIPYSTITVPRTDIINNTTVYETQYVYTSSSGDTIIATSPPTNPPSQNPSGGSGGGGSDYNPIDPYSIPEVSWFTSAEIGDTSYDGIDSIMQGFDSIDTIGSEYTDGMDVVEDSMGTLPISWLLLIGIVGAIPLIAGIISRFLS